MSTFDPESFMQTQFTGANDTRFQPCPAGEYPAVVEKVTPREWVSQVKGTSGIALDVSWSIDSPQVREALGRDKVNVTQSIFLDTTPAGGLDMGTGKNINLGRLREAVGLNDPSRAFAVGDFVGKVAKVRVIHEPYKGEVFAKIDAVSRL